MNLRTRIADIISGGEITNLNDLSASLQALWESTVRKAKADVEQQSTKVATLEVANQGLETKLADVNNSHQQTITALEAANQGLEAKLTDVNNSHQQTITALESKAVGLQLSLDSMATEVDVVAQKCREEVDEAARDRDRLKSSLDDHISQTAAIIEKYESVLQKIAACETTRANHTVRKMAELARNGAA